MYSFFEKKNRKKKKNDVIMINSSWHSHLNCNWLLLMITGVHEYMYALFQKKK